MQAVATMASADRAGSQRNAPRREVIPSTFAPFRSLAAVAATARRQTDLCLLAEDAHVALEMSNRPRRRRPPGSPTGRSGAARIGVVELTTAAPGVHAHALV